MASQLMDIPQAAVHLDMLPADDAEHVQLVQRDQSVPEHDPGEPAQRRLL